MCGMSDPTEFTPEQRQALAETGRLMDEHLRSMGRTFDWFLEQLHDMGLAEDDVIDHETWTEIMRRARSSKHAN
jgi:uncharacterized membrane protein YcaP (DUF421 family)